MAVERGFLLHRLTAPSRILLLLIALALFYPVYWVKIIGLGGLIGMIYLSFVTMRRKALKYEPIHPEKLKRGRP